MSDMEHRAEINTELLYAPIERRYAQELYEQDHADGPEWQQADAATRGQYLEKGAYRCLGEMFGQR
jgi:hypothetical protein